jgi:methionyl-tRNA formyltransferase
MADRRLILFAMTQRGLAVLQALVESVGADSVAAVIVQPEKGVDLDFSQETARLAHEHRIPVLGRHEPLPDHSFAFAVGWKYMLREEPRLVVFHESLLPRYRGFAPLANALINGEPEIGVSALWANDRVDGGTIIEQVPLALQYPITLRQATDKVVPLHATVAAKIARRLIAGEQVEGRVQDERLATYSPWRDEDDYLIDWELDATSVRRFIDALGSPYMGASAYVGKRKMRILRATVELDEPAFELRHTGKVFSIDDGIPTVICGRGMLRLLDVSDASTGDSLLPWGKLRARFSATPR